MLYKVDKALCAKDLDCCSHILKLCPYHTKTLDLLLEKCVIQIHKNRTWETILGNRKLLQIPKAPLPPRRVALTEVTEETTPKGRVNHTKIGIFNFQKHMLSFYKDL